MKLGLSLGEGKKPFDFLSKNPATTTSAAAARIQTDSGLGFCMDLAIITDGTTEAKRRRRGPDDDDEYLDESTRESSHNRKRVSSDRPVHLDLLPLAPVPRQSLGLPWFSDNGSLERDSSGNGLRGFDVNKPPSAEDEALSPKSVASSFPMEFSLFRGLENGGGKRDSEADGNDLFEVERATSRGSDEDENGLNSRKKLRLNKEQSAFLEESFKEQNTLNPKHKLALARQLNLRPRQVEVWFQNRRARTKLKQTEVDCEYLKRCYETLTEENRRLHKELQELRALKASNPFYLQSPATTLAMCPSCERVGPTSAAPPITISSVATATANDSTTPKGMTFPMHRPKFFPFSNKRSTTHSHQSAAS